MKDNAIELFAKVHGRVQGVFFRATVERYAKEIGIHGFVENREDGSVEITAQGKKEDLERLVEMIKEHPGMAEISSIETKYREVKTAHLGFKVKR